MERRSCVVRVLIFLISFVHLSSADTHSLQFLFTAVTGINFPEFTAVGLVDEEQFVYYDSHSMKVILKTEWIKKIDANGKNYWNSEISQDQQVWFDRNVASAMQSFNHTKGVVHTVQYMYGCELDDDGTSRGYYQDGYDGEDFIGLDLQAGTWISNKPEAKIIEKEWESTGHEAKYCKDYLNYDCVETLKKFLSFSRETLERKVRPEASLFQKHSSPEVVCHATGFFPKALYIRWQKDGDDVYEDVELGEALTNQDGSFQKRSILKVSAEELQKHNYTCVIQHSSLEKILVLPVSERRILRGGESGGALTGIIIAVVICLVALVVVVGIVVWKKKSSGFKPVPAKASSDGDSSSNNS